MSDRTNYIELRDTLANLYLDKDAAQRIITDANIRLEFIKFGDTAIENWSNIIQEATKQDLLKDLIELAIRQYPKDETLKRVFNILKAGGKILKADSPEPQFHSFLLDLQPDLAALEKECRTANVDRALRELRDTITIRLRTLGKNSGLDKTEEPLMHLLRRLGTSGKIPSEIFTSLEYALTVTSETLYGKEVEKQEAIRAVQEAAVGLNFINLSDQESPHFRIVALPYEKFSFVFSIEGKELFLGDIYVSKKGVLGGIRAVRSAVETLSIGEHTAPPRGLRIEEFTNVNGHAFRIVAPNSEILGISPNFASKRAMNRAREALLEFVPKAPIIMDNTK